MKKKTNSPKVYGDKRDNVERIKQKSIPQNESNPSDNYFTKRREEINRNKNFYIGDDEDLQLKIFYVRLDELQKAEENFYFEEQPKAVAKLMEIAKANTISLKDFELFIEEIEETIMQTQNLELITRAVLVGRIRTLAEKFRSSNVK